jgi:uncharacterized RDD family membrane protein YckC/DNA-directed RNA polymerase subunit RPC12/RpoP
MARKNREKRAGKKGTAREAARAKREEGEDPSAPQAEEESASGLFKEAIEAFKRSGALPPDAEQKGKETHEDETADKVVEEEKTADPPVPEAEAGRKKEGEECEEASGEGKDGAGAKRSDALPKPEAGTGPPEEVEEAEEAEEAESAAAEHMVRKTVHKKGKPDSVMEAFEPTEYEVHGSVIKFECRCGKRVSAPADAKSFVGKCPKCGVRLLLPKAPEGEGKEKAQVSRTRPPPKARRAPAPSAPPPSPAAWISRFVAFQIDLAVPVGLFLGLFFLLRSLDVAADTYWTVSLSAAAVAWLVGTVLLPAVASASLGMRLAGLRYRGPDGGPLSFIEALGRSVAGILLSPLAPLALADRGGRTTADHVTGCTVVVARAGETKGSGEAARLKEVKEPGEKDAPDTPR